MLRTVHHVFNSADVFLSMAMIQRLFFWRSMAPGTRGNQVPGIWIAARSFLPSQRNIYNTTALAPVNNLLFYRRNSPGQTDQLLLKSTLKQAIAPGEIIRAYHQLHIHYQWLAHPIALSSPYAQIRASDFLLCISVLPATTCYHPTAAFCEFIGNSCTAVGTFQIWRMSVLRTTE